MASPIKQTGASKSQIPIPSLLLGIKASEADAAGLVNGWGSDAGGKAEPGNGEFGMPFQLGLISCCGGA